MADAAVICNDKPYHCAECDKAFTQNRFLETHMRTHTGEKPYPYAEIERWRHLAPHMGEKPYPCTLCDKAFTQKGALVSHMHTHTGEKPYPCTLCDKAFAECESLTSHLRVKHTKE